MIGFAFALLLLPPPGPDCGHDRTALLALDQDSFDQDLKGGWRALSAKGCTREAADLIRDWRIAHKAEDTILYWHEGQLRAEIDETEAAIALFRQSYKPADQDYGGSWRPYVDGSIAFLRRDRAGLEAERARLAALPRPVDFEEEAKGPDGKPILMPDGKPWRISWPPNLNVLDRLLRCWGKPYREAYSCPEPAGK